jgi:hypothetical protein
MLSNPEVPMKCLPLGHPRRFLALLPLLAGFALLLLAPAGQSQDEIKKQPEPDKELQAKKQGILNKMFKEELSKKAEPGVARQLAETLLSEAIKTKDDAALRFVALVMARDLAAEAGDTVTALAAIDEIAKYYTADSLAMKANMVKLAAEKATSKEDNEAITELALSLLEEAIANDSYTVGEQLAKAAEEAATKTKIVPLYAKVEKRTAELEQAKKEFGRMAKYVEILKTTPDNAEANYEMGKYLCLVKGNWEKGLPLLLKGTDKVYTELAKRDLANPKETAVQLELGDEYAGLADNEKGLTQKMLLKRALHWYAKCAPTLEGGLNKVRVEKAIEEITKLFPSGPVVGFGSSVISTQLRSFDKGHFNGIQCLAISSDGKLVLSGGTQEGTVRLWDFAKGKELKQLNGHTNEIWGVAFSPDNKVGASASTDQTMRTWDLNNGAAIRQFFGHKDWVRGVFFMPDKKHIITASDDHRLVIWDLGNGNQVKTMQGHTNFINGFAMTKDGKRAVTGSDDNTIRVWDLTNATEIAKFIHNNQVWSVAISNDGKKVVSAGSDSNVRVWDVDKKAEIRKLEHPTRVWSMAFSPDGRQLVCGTGGGVNQVPKGINFGPNPPQFGQQDNALYFWEFETGKFVRRLTGPNGHVRAIVWTPDGRNVISGGLDNMIRVWGEGKGVK